MSKRRKFSEEHVVGWSKSNIQDRQKVLKAALMALRQRPDEAQVIRGRERQ